MSKEAHYQLARDFFAAVTAGDLPDALLTDDMTGWITTGGTMPKAQYQRLIRVLAAMLDGPLVFTIRSLTADEDRVVAECDSVGRLVDGNEYRQTYIYVFRVRDGRLASVAEHYNALTAQEKLLPLMVAAIAKVDA